MFKPLFIIVVIFCLTLTLATDASSDRFDLLLKRLNAANCLSMDFISIIESNIFDDIDSTSGELFVSADGRFFLNIGTDQFLFDGTKIYTYSEAANQVVIETPIDSASTSKEFSFLLMLDKLYTIEPISLNEEYQLRIKSRSAENYPDSMIAIIDNSDKILKQLEYYDINDDLNIINVSSMELTESCSTDVFVPSFPDSAERVKL